MKILDFTIKLVRLQMQYVRGLHNLVRHDMNERVVKDPQAVYNKTRVPGDFTGCPVSAAMKRELDSHVKRSCPFSKLSKRDLADNTVEDVSISAAFRHLHPQQA